MILTTERLVLRPFESSDAAAVYAYACDPQVGPMAGWKPHTSLAESQRIVEKFQTDALTFAITLKEDHQAIGSISLSLLPHADGSRGCELGYALGRHHWGLGLMPEACRAVMAYAFNDLHMAYIRVCHFPHNLQSKRVIEKLGFHLTGYSTHASLLYDGQWMDEWVYRLDRDDWLFQQSSR